MLISEDYKQLAERCMRLASECSEPRLAAALRALATDYLARAGSPAGRGRALSWELGCPQRIGKAKFDQRAHGIRLEIDAGA